MKKKTLLTMICALGLLGAYAQQSEITVKGSIKFPDNKFPISVYYYNGSEKIIVDSIPLKSDNTFEKKIQLPFPGVYRLDCQKWEVLSFWGENEDIEVNFRGQDTAKVKIKNPPYEHIVNAGKNNELMNLKNFFDYQAYQRMIAAGQETYRAGQANCEEWKKYATEAMMKLYDTDPYLDYLAMHYSDRNSVVALLPLIRNKAVKEQLIAKLEKERPNYAPFVKYKKEQAEKLAQMNKLAPGKPAPEFSYPTPDGKKKLGPKDYKGKYLLIDFWASWCGPCRKAIPQVKAAYEKFKSKGLEILSVSIDAKRDAWLKSVKEENMPWKQVCAPHSGKEAMKLYQFNGIPHLVLIDKDGKILKRGITPDKLEQVLGEILK